MVRRFARFMAVAAVVALPAVVQAQTTCNAVSGGSACTVSATANLTIPAIASVTIPSNTIALTFPATPDFSVVQYAGGAFGSVDVRANTPYALTIGTAATDWTGPGTRSASTLEYSIDGGAFTAIVPLGTAALPGGPATNITSSTLAFQAVIPIGLANTANTPGAYSLQVDFTLTAP
jgi:hypothetical protein